MFIRIWYPLATISLVSKTFMYIKIGCFTKVHIVQFLLTELTTLLNTNSYWFSSYVDMGTTAYFESDTAFLTSNLKIKDCTYLLIVTNNATVKGRWSSKNRHCSFYNAFSKKVSHLPLKYISLITYCGDNKTADLNSYEVKIKVY